MEKSIEEENIEILIKRYNKHRKWVIGLLITGILGLFFGLIPSFLLLAGFIGELKVVNKNKKKINTFIKGLIDTNKSKEIIIDSLHKKGLSKSKSEEFTDYQWILSGKK